MIIQKGIKNQNKPSKFPKNTHIGKILILLFKLLSCEQIGGDIFHFHVMDKRGLCLHLH